MSKSPAPKMAPGDLLFAAIGDEDNLISVVGEGHRGARLNHVGIVVERDGVLGILEAIDPVVTVTSLSDYVARSFCAANQPRILFARLKSQHRHLVPDALAHGLTQLGVPYDRYYGSSKNALYCSELILDMFCHANGGQMFFPNALLSFRDIQTGELLPEWVQHYAEVGQDVPEGAPGSHPAGLSQDPRIEVFHLLGNIPGLQNAERQKKPHWFSEAF